MPLYLNMHHPYLYTPLLLKTHCLFVLNSLTNYSVLECNKILVVRFKNSYCARYEQKSSLCTSVRVTEECCSVFWCDLNFVVLRSSAEHFNVCHLTQRNIPPNISGLDMRNFFGACVTSYGKNYFSK